MERVLLTSDPEDRSNNGGKPYPVEYRGHPPCVYNPDQPYKEGLLEAYAHNYGPDPERWPDWVKKIVEELDD